MANAVIEKEVSQYFLDNLIKSYISPYFSIVKIHENPIMEIHADLHQDLHMEDTDAGNSRSPPMVAPLQMQNQVGPGADFRL